MTAVATNTAPATAHRMLRALAAIAARLLAVALREPRLPISPVSTWPSTDAATRLHIVSAGARFR